ncbi:MAG: hypothetical protein ACLPN5_00450 [Roseiarcus sp.]
MTDDAKGRLSAETFDEFLAEQGLLDCCEHCAIEELSAELLAEATKAPDRSEVDRTRRTDPFPR